MNKSVKGNELKVYHGSTISKAQSVIDNQGNFRDYSFPGLYVTDTKERAVIYANAQASEIVDPEAKSLKNHAVVVTIEVEKIEWFRRPASHGSLDKCESIIESGKVVEIEYKECDYAHCTCHAKTKTLKVL